MGLLRGSHSRLAGSVGSASTLVMSSFLGDLGFFDCLFEINDDASNWEQYRRRFTVEHASARVSGLASG